MKTKLPYNSPAIEWIRLDSTIALQLQSDADPMGEPDWASRIVDTPTTDPMQTSVV